MEIKKTASGKKVLRMSRKEWEKIGQLGGFDVDPFDNPDNYTGRHSIETEVVIDGKPVPVIVGFDAHPAMREPHGELTPSEIELVGVWGMKPDGSMGDSVWDLLGDEQLEALIRQIDEESRV